MLGLFFSLIGIVLVRIITLPFVGLFVILRGRKEFSCLSCGMLSRRYPPLSMGAGSRMRCGYCGQKTLIPSNSPAAQQVMARSVTPPVTHFVPSVPRLRRSKIALYLLLIFGVPAAIWFIVYASNAPTSAPTPLAATTAEPAQPTQDNAPQTSEVTDSETTQTPEESQNDKQEDLGWTAMKIAVNGTPTAFNEQKNLRFDSVIVMPDDTVCLSVHDANPRAAEIGLVEPSALIYLPRRGGGEIFGVTDVTVSIWTRECIDQQGGVDVLPDIEAHVNKFQHYMNDLEQQLKSSQQ